MTTTTNVTGTVQAPAESVAVAVPSQTIKVVIPAYVVPAQTLTITIPAQSLTATIPAQTETLTINDVTSMDMATLAAQLAPYLGITPPVTPPVVNPSPSGTVIAAGSGLTITDASLNKWTIVNGQVAINGTVDTSTSGVTKLAYVGTVIWQENTSNLWWGKSSLTGAWLPSDGTAVSPLV